MPSKAHILATVERYANAFSARDRAGWLALFTEDVEVAEPADAPIRRGKEVFAQVFDAVYGAGMQVALKPLRVIVNGNEAAVHMQVHVTDGKAATENSVIEIFTVAEDGRIARFRAFLDMPPPNATHQ